jgi:hypothetical protein
MRPTQSPEIFVNPYFYEYLSAEKYATVARFHMTTHNLLMDAAFASGHPPDFASRFSPVTNHESQVTASLIYGTGIRNCSKALKT